MEQSYLLRSHSKYRSKLVERTSLLRTWKRGHTLTGMLKPGHTLTCMLKSGHTLPGMPKRGHTLLGMLK